MLVSADKLNGNAQSDRESIGRLIQIGRHLEYVAIGFLSGIAGDDGLAAHHVGELRNHARERPVGIGIRRDEELLPDVHVRDIVFIHLGADAAAGYIGHGEERTGGNQPEGLAFAQKNAQDRTADGRPNHAFA